MAPDPDDDASDGIGPLLDRVADSWTHVLSGLTEGVNGTYSASDVFEDVVECSMRAAEMGMDLLRAVGLLPPAVVPLRNPTEVVVEVPIDAAGAATATNLTCSDLRGIGFGVQYTIPAAMVTVGAPAPGKNGDMTVPVTVCFANVGRFERQRTIVYEGTITAPPPPTGAPPWTGVVRVPKPAQ